jgi:hypothetical protein
MHLHKFYADGTQERGARCPEAFATCYFLHAGFAIEREIDKHNALLTAEYSEAWHGFAA